MDPDWEARRLERLHAIGILDSAEDRVFRDLAEQALALLPGTSIGAISLVDAHRQRFKAIIGLDTKETPRSVSFCSHTIETGGVLLVQDATRDSRFAEIPLVTSASAIRFYAGVKLVNGVGALCVMGQQPRRVTEAEITKLTKLAKYVDIQLLAYGTMFNLPRA